jgi:hypothetical protein
VEQRLDFGIEAILQAQHGFGVPARCPATHPGLAIDPGVQPDGASLPLEPCFTVTITFQPARLGAYGASELVGGRVLGDRYQTRCQVDQLLSYCGFDLT